MGETASTALAFSIGYLDASYLIFCCLAAFALRKNMPFASRSPLLMGILALYMIFNAVTRPLYYVDCRNQCWAQVAVSLGIIGGHAWPLIAQGYIVVKQISWGERQILLAMRRNRVSDEGDCSGESTPVLKRLRGYWRPAVASSRGRIKDPWWLAAAVLSGIAVPAGMKLAFLAQVSCDEFARDGDGRVLAVQGAELLICVFFAMLLVMKLRKQSDSYGIARMLFRMSVFAVVFLMLTILWRIVGLTWHPAVRLAMFTIETCVPATVIFGVSALQSWQEKSRLATFVKIESVRPASPKLVAETPAAGVLPELSLLIADAVALAAFKRHLVSEFSVENLLFWLDARHYSSLSRLEMPSRAWHIIDLYVKPLAEMEINLPHEIVLKLLALVPKDCDSQTFREAENEIYKLMVQDSYPRFAKTVEGKKLLTSRPICNSRV